MLDIRALIEQAFSESILEEVLVSKIQDRIDYDEIADTLFEDLEEEIIEAMADYVRDIL